MTMLYNFAVLYNFEQGALPAFDTLEAYSCTQASEQRNGYHDGGLPASQHNGHIITADEIINYIGYGPLQASSGKCGG